MNTFPLGYTGRMSEETPETYSFGHGNAIVEPKQLQLDLGITPEDQQEQNYARQSMKKEMGGFALTAYLQSLDSNLTGDLLGLVEGETRFIKSNEQRLNDIIEAAKLTGKRELITELLHRYEQTRDLQ